MIEEREYIVPVRGVARGTVVVRALSPEDALDKVQQNDLTVGDMDVIEIDDVEPTGSVKGVQENR